MQGVLLREESTEILQLSAHEQLAGLARPTLGLVERLRSGRTLKARAFQLLKQTASLLESISEPQAAADLERLSTAKRLECPGRYASLYTVLIKLRRPIRCRRAVD